MVTVTLVITLFAMAYAIDVDNGIINMDEYNCTVYVNSVNQTVVGKQVIGLQFGIVDYYCPRKEGTIISRLKCHPCGLFCKSNEMIIGCQSLVVPMAVGVLIGTILGLILLFIFNKRINDSCRVFLNWVMYLKQIRYDKQVERQTDKVEKIINVKVPYKYKDVCELDMVKRNQVNERRMSKQVSKAKALALIGLTATAPVTSACDKTLFLTSTGNICEDNSCSDSTVINLSLSLGNHVCLNTYDGVTTEIRISESYYRMRYTHSYDTSSFTASTDKEWLCKSASSACWNGGCLPNEKHSKYSETNSTLTRYGCIVGVLGCDDWCFHTTSCTWYKIELLPKGEPKGVYNFQSKIWEVLVDVTRHGYTVRHMLNANNPFLNMGAIGGKNMSIPMMINSVLSEEYKVSESILTHDGHAYEVVASSQNYPLVGTFGDFQINTKGVKVYPMDDIKVDVRSCQVYSTFKEPQIDRFLANINNYIKTKYKTIDGTSIIETRINTVSTYNFMMQLDGFKSMIYDPSECEYEIASSFACEECGAKPHVVLVPTVVKHLGVMEIMSNCTLESYFLPCGPEPSIIKFNTHPQTCEVLIKKTNSTLIVKFDYIYKGDLSAMTTRITHSAQEDLQSLVTNANFVTGMVSSLTTIASLSVIVTFILRLIRLYQIERMNKSMEKA